ncbi:MAG: hypothetical protein JWM50_2066 [Microbacteriaceae bacterium]|nr:hypothetical protein [Microbacteriaceae bacterium]
MCGPDAHALPPGVTASIKQYRLDYAPRALELSVTTGSSDVLSVTAASFESPHFDTDGSDWTRDIEVS